LREALIESVAAWLGARSSFEGGLSAATSG